MFFLFLASPDAPDVILVSQSVHPGEWWILDWYYLSNYGTDEYDKENKEDEEDEEDEEVEEDEVDEEDEDNLEDEEDKEDEDDKKMTFW